MIRGKVVIDKKTKDLVKRIRANQIAVIDHQDIDHLASKSLIDKQVKAVLNLSTSMSGRYPNHGPKLLLDAHIPLIDIKLKGRMFSLLYEGDTIEIRDGQIYRDGEQIASGREITRYELDQKTRRARENIKTELSKFIDNTLNYAKKEKNLIVDLTAPDIGIDFSGRHVLIVVRGVDYKDDLVAIKSYIREMNPIIIAVDGGADACLESGYRPDVLIGDMDSVSDYALKKVKKIILHAYPDGQAPGLKRIRELGLEYILYPAPGTSEDIAMILAHDRGAELITAVGTHSNMIDFLEKGRKGMASTLLVRLKLGNKLVDAKGVSKLYQNKICYKYWLQFTAAVLIPLIFVVLYSPPIKQILQLLALRLRIFLN
ncbi:MAG: putative cytokinetic ring protein SteA [Halanaerobiales bacterium]